MKNTQAPYACKGNLIKHEWIGIVNPGEVVGWKASIATTSEMLDNFCKSCPRKSAECETIRQDLVHIFEKNNFPHQKKQRENSRAKIQEWRTTEQDSEELAWDIPYETTEKNMKTD
jgi:hypothetical protein